MEVYAEMLGVDITGVEVDGGRLAFDEGSAVEAGGEILGILGEDGLFEAEGLVATAEGDEFGMVAGWVNQEILMTAHIEGGLLTASKRAMQYRSCHHGTSSGYPRYEFPRE